MIRPLKYCFDSYLCNIRTTSDSTINFLLESKYYDLTITVLDKF